MALRLDKCVVRGWLDNTIPGQTLGEIWLLNREHPVQLDLHGNCLRDLAGCRIEFENAKPASEKSCRQLRRYQVGTIGDATAARQVKILTEPIDEVVRRRREDPESEPPATHLASCLYLEWFGRCNGRVLIESVDFDVRVVKEASWQMTAEQESEQISANLRAMERFFDQLPGSNDEDLAVANTMNEFEWEMQLRHSDERGQKYAELLERYQDHPNSERLIAREMGWNHLEDLLDAEARGIFRPTEEEPTEYDLPQPNPLTEGKDWITNPAGRPVHPLQHRASELAAEIRGLDGFPDPDASLARLGDQSQALASKLAGALNGLAYDHCPEPGFVVASLKRALTCVNSAFSALREVERTGQLTKQDANRINDALFAIREEMLRLMDNFRKHPGF